MIILFKKDFVLFPPFPADVEVLPEVPEAPPDPLIPAPPAEPPLLAVGEPKCPSPLEV